MKVELEEKLLMVTHLISPTMDSDLEIRIRKKVGVR